MIEIRLWKPCLNCPHADVVDETENVTTCGHGKTVYTKHVITCEHAPVCRRIEGARALIGGGIS